MAFQTIDFLVFMLLLLGSVPWLQHRAQNLVLLVASYTFYGWVSPWWCFLMGTTTVVDWFCARRLSSRSGVGRRRWLVLSLVTNFSILCGFKYLGFFVSNVTALFATLGWMPSPWLLHIALPAGISFFTFQSASYVIDVYRGEVEARRSIWDYALFVSFFPQLVAGPIERAENLLRQVCAPRIITQDGIRSGIILFLWGLMQKLVIADNAALLANKVFSIKDASFPVLWGGVIAFGVQIYADFSGYTDMARGAARTLGFELRLNFNHPYLAQSPGDFWRRWHMSLSTWFRDYVYIPLGGSRHGVARMKRNLFITFLLSGLWHGASWNFILWGAFHGVLVAFWPKTSASNTWWRVALRIITTWCLMHIGWLMFRERTSLSMLVHYFTLNPLAASAADWRIGISFALEALIYGLPLLLLLPAVEKLGLLISKDDPAFNTWPNVTVQAVMVAALVFIIAALRCPVTSDFIYFQF